MRALASFHLAAAFLVCFDAFLRPGELYRLICWDVIWAGGLAVLSLRQTKSGHRKNAAEMLVCHSKIANQWLWKGLANKQPNEPLLDETPAQFRSLFFHILDHLQVPGYFSLYSFRRGGATRHFLSDNNIEQTLSRGRWASTSTARIYLQDAAAALSHLEIDEEQRQYMQNLASYLSAHGQDGKRGRR